ncbi:MAG: hypothetical protein KBE91_11890 [Bacteroidia bacterium]|nr:hypothetical protein [Bacteroidia bacterium]
MPSLALGLGLSKNNVAVFTRSEAVIIVKDFRARVIADGGTFEAYDCMVGDINELLALNQIATTFNLRVLADSGTFEQINCLQTTITDLQNINIS